jgi:lipopolysaccharide transport system permease protein
MKIIKKNKKNNNVIIEIISYKFFIIQFVKRNILLIYKQTVLGKFWPIINIFLQSGIFTIIFSNLLSLSTDGVPPFLFYMCGMLVWIFFQSNTLKTSQVFTNFGHFFSGAYFPRIIIPIALVIENFIFLIINLVFFLFFYILMIFYGFNLRLNYLLLIFLPLIFIYLALMSLSFGLLVSCLSAKYRDLALISNHGLQLLFFATPVIYSSQFLSGSFDFLPYFNPVIYPLVLFKSIFFSTEILSFNVLLVNIIMLVIIFSFSIFYFNKVSRTVVDYA